MIKRKNFLKNISIIVLMGLVFHCDNNPLYPDPTSFDFAIYLLDDPAFDREKLWDEDYSDFQLTGEPWLTDEDIEFYDWSSHCIYLKIDKKDLFPQYDDKYFIELFTNKMFVLAVNGEICYPAYFNYRYHYPIPELDLLALLFYPDDVLRIEWTILHDSEPRNDVDRRNNVRVKNVLIQEGLFHAGLEVHLDTVTIMENADTSTIEYSFTLTNKDEDNLYIFDPDIVGNSIHFYTNGPVFLHVEESNLYQSTYKKVDPLKDWDPSWYVKLESGESLTRTVRLRGYPHFPPGTYGIDFFYNGPRINKEDRYAADGRYWFGGVESNYLTVYIDSI